jgi:hypothetical protein
MRLAKVAAALRSTSSGSSLITAASHTSSTDRADGALVTLARQSLTVTAADVTAWLGCGVSSWR